VLPTDLLAVGLAREDRDLDAAVLLAAPLLVVGGEGLMDAAAGCVEPVRRDAERGEVAGRGAGAPLG